MESEAKLRVRGLSKTFRARNSTVNALRDVNIDVTEGEFVCVVGQSGCGKTTLLNLIAGFEHPDEGTIEIRNTHGQRGPQKLVIFQEPSLFPWLSVRGNVEFGLRMAGAKREVRDEVADRYLELVGLSGSADSYIHQLSGGMKQRVVLARALVMDPELLLMDEPFAALDPQTRENLHGELLRISAETRKTILFITHNIDEAVYLADRVLVLSPQPGTFTREFVIGTPKPRTLGTPLVKALMEGIKDSLSLGGAPSEALA